MAIPAGFSIAPNGFFYYTDGSGPYNVDTQGNATLIGSGSSSGGGSGGGDPVPEPDVAKISRIIEGGGFAWTSGLNGTIAACTYVINGVLYSSPQTNVTAAAADGSNPRFDVVTFTSSSTATLTQGTAAASPSVPEVNPDTQVAGAIIRIDAAATAITGSAATKDIYHESTEWTDTYNGGMSSSATTPIVGSASVLATAAAAIGSYARFVDSADLDLADSTNLVFTYKGAGALNSAFRLNIGWYTNGGALRGQLVSFKPGDYGSSASSTSAQQIVIPLSAFAANGLAVRRLQMTVAGAVPGNIFQLDTITLQALGGIVVDDSKLQWEGLWNTNRLYSLNQVVRYGRALYRALRVTTGENPVTVTTAWERIGYYNAAAVALTDGANIATNAALADDFYVTLGGNRTLDNPTNMYDGQKINWRIVQDGTGSRTLAFGNKFIFAGGSKTVSTAAAAIDVLCGWYDATSDKIHCALSKAYAA